MFFAFLLAPRMAPSNNAASSATMARTVRSSVSVKPRFDQSLGVVLRRATDICEYYLSGEGISQRTICCSGVRAPRESSPFVFFACSGTLNGGAILRRTLTFRDWRSKKRRLSLLHRLGFEKSLQLANARRGTHLSEGLGLDLADAVARDF